MYKLQEGMYIIPREGKMNVPGLLIGTEELIHADEMGKPIEQVRNVAHLPGIVGYSIAMPDIHWGYGFPIGGVAATDAKTGVISPGGVGYDINCGVRLATINLSFKDIEGKIREKLIQSLYKHVPSGVGKGHKKNKALTEKDYKSLLLKGAAWSVEQGYGLPEDLEHTESHGCIEGGAIDAITQHAMERGEKQLGSVGSGNHFVEIGTIQEIFAPDIAKIWGIEKGQTYVLIHSGSRGFGHQTCQDTLHAFLKKGYDKGLPDKQLVAAPLNSPDGKRYFQAMTAAANYAFNNRQQLLHFIRKSINEVLNIPPHDVRQLYDVCHNIAKFEKHEINGSLKTVCVHRKGATRAFGPEAEELAPIFKKTGQPVLVPGDMGRASHLLSGLGNPLTFASCCHGAGRARSRHKAMQSWKGRDPIAHMKKEGVLVVANSIRTIAEEMPDAYKNVDEVVEAVVTAKLAQKVARLKPALVLKG